MTANERPHPNGEMLPASNPKIFPSLFTMPRHNPLNWSKLKRRQPLWVCRCYYRLKSQL